MARIRSIKPEFFRHEGLQDLEAANPGSYVMLVFAGLWGHCDKAGRFVWKPRTLKLDVLPFLDFDMEATLAILEAAGFVRRYFVEGKEYGAVPTFETHQRISGKEAQEPEKHPAESANAEGSKREAKGKQLRRQEGKGREEEEEGNGVRACAPSADVAPERSDPIPYAAIVEIFNRTMERLPKVRELTTKRKTLIRSAWQASPQRQDVNFWQALCEEYADDPFTNGTGPYKNGHENWRPGFDYLFRADVITKAYERAMDRMERAA